MPLNQVHHKRTKVCSEEYNFIWKIDGFPKFLGCPDLLANQRICFRMGSKIHLPTEWHCILQKNPNGDGTKIFLGLLDSPSDASKVVVNFQAYRARKRGGKWFDSAFTEHMVEDGIRRRKSLPYIIESNMSSMQDHCKHNGGALVLHVSVTLFNLDRTERLNLFKRHLSDWNDNQQQKFEPEVAKRYQKLKKENAHTILISSDEKKFPVMRDVLCKKSAVFAGMFQSGMQEENGIVNVSDVSGIPLKLLLEYIHTGKLNKSWTKPEIIEEFVYATHKYMLKDLLNFQDNMLGYYCNRENLDALLDLAKLLELKQAEKDLTECKNMGTFWSKTSGNISLRKYLKFLNVVQ